MVPSLLPAVTDTPRASTASPAASLTWPDSPNDAELDSTVTSPDSAASALDTSKDPLVVELPGPELMKTLPEVAAASVKPDATVIAPPSASPAAVPARTFALPDTAELEPTVTASPPEEPVLPAFPLPITASPEVAVCWDDTPSVAVTTEILPLTDEESLEPLRIEIDPPVSAELDPADNDTSPPRAPDDAPADNAISPEPEALLSPLAMLKSPLPDVSAAPLNTAKVPDDDA